MHGGRQREVVDALSPWLQSLSDKDRLILYWTGHGARSGDYYFITSDSPRRRLTDANAFSAHFFGSLIADCQAEKILLFIDTCYSSEGARTIAEQVVASLAGRTARPGQQQFLAVIRRRIRCRRRRRRSSVAP